MKPMGLIEPVSQQNKYYLFPCFEYIISRALLLTGHLEETSYYTNYSDSHYLHKNSKVEAGLYQTISLVKALNLKQQLATIISETGFSRLIKKLARV